jgi:hypothetical protein
MMLQIHLNCMAVAVKAVMVRQVQAEVLAVAVRILKPLMSH